MSMEALSEHSRIVSTEFCFFQGDAGQDGANGKKGRKGSMVY